MKLLVINGPNINLVGNREVEIYGEESYEALVDMIVEFGKNNGVQTDVFQSNDEGALIDKIQSAQKSHVGIVINPGAYTHYSIAILDALKCCGLPAVEVHLSNIAAREEYRRKSVTAQGCIGQISGFGFDSYLLAITALIGKLNSRQSL